MPCRNYRHECAAVGRVVTGNLPTPCDRCSAIPEFDRWVWSGIESWGRFQRFTRLRVKGPHRLLANQLLLDEGAESCPDCGGNGLIDPECEEDFELCRHCKNTGWMPRDPKQFEELRARVLAEFPEARL